MCVTICCGVRRGRRCSEVVRVGVVVSRGAEPDTGRVSGGTGAESIDVCVGVFGGG